MIKIEIPEGLAASDLDAYVLKILSQMEDVFIINNDGTEQPAPLVSIFKSDNGNDNNNRPRRSSAPAEND